MLSQMKFSVARQEVQAKNIVRSSIFHFVLSKCKLLEIFFGEIDLIFCFTSFLVNVVSKNIKMEKILLPINPKAIDMNECFFRRRYFDERKIVIDFTIEIAHTFMISDRRFPQKSSTLFVICSPSIYIIFPSGYTRIPFTN